jgi:murein L,D-transpeptidase YafK
MRRLTLLLAVVIVIPAVTFVLVKRSRNGPLRQRTVTGVVADLKKMRGREFLQTYPNLGEINDILLIAIKDKRRLEVWTRLARDKLFRFRKRYGFTGFSGRLGPKRLSGDRQIPEGIYDLTGLNPNSRHHVSIRVGYPNAVDLKFASAESRTDLGGDIFIHGGNTTIGCIPIGDRNTEELFILLAERPESRPQIIIMPVDFRLKKHRSYSGRTAYEKQVYELIRKELQRIA